MLWFAWLAANLTMWMNDVAAAWLMSQLTTNATMVALVQAASTLPVFLLGLPSGALADIVDRRRFLAFTQLWIAIVAAGERWADGSLRPSAADQLVAGRVVDALAELGIDFHSPACAIACAAAVALRGATKALVGAEAAALAPAHAHAHATATAGGDR